LQRPLILSDLNLKILGNIGPGPPYPSFCDPGDWALFRHQDSDESERLARVLAQDGIYSLADRIKHKLAPMNPGVLLNCYFSQKILGDEKAAAELYQEAIAIGMPLPPLS